MTTVKKSRRPWLDHRGRPLPTETLRELSKSWSEKTWEKYLHSLDGSIEGLQLMSSRKLRAKTEYQVHSIFDLHAEKSDTSSIKNKIFESLSVLTGRQREVIEAIFYGGLSIEETAAKLKLTKSTVFEHQKDALTKLRGALAVRPNDLTKMRGEENDEVNNPAGIDPEIYEVFLADSQRHGWNSKDFDKERA